mgnify:CR=1 FL=1
MDFKKGLTFTIILLLIGLGIAIIVGSNQGRDVFFIKGFDAIVNNSSLSLFFLSRKVVFAERTRQELCFICPK